MMNNELKKFDLEILKKNKRLLAIDEVGRGCIAGPLVVVGLILKNTFFDPKIKDSKKIKSILLRKQLKELIIKNSIKIEFRIFDPEFVDINNPKKTSKIGMFEIASKLVNDFDICITDYEKIDNLEINQMNIIKGDEKSYSIACASIVAKSIRDECIFKLNEKFPEYDLINNQGYLTNKHKKLIKKFGPKKNLHRFSYNFIKEFL